jgi:hypothetical protein
VSVAALVRSGVDAFVAGVSVSILKLSAGRSTDREGTVANVIGTRAKNAQFATLTRDVVVGCHDRRLFILEGESLLVFDSFAAGIGTDPLAGNGSRIGTVTRNWDGRVCNSAGSVTRARASESGSRCFRANVVVNAVHGMFDVAVAFDVAVNIARHAALEIALVVDFVECEARALRHSVAKVLANLHVAIRNVAAALAVDEDP